jgi:ribose transport system permease protein
VSALLARLLNRQGAMLIVAAALYAGFALNAQHFVDSQTQFEILRVVAFALLIGLPLTYLVIAGEVDLSIGSNSGLCSVITASAIVNWGWNSWLAALLAVAIGAAVGLFNGLVVVKLRVPSFILTIGMLSLLRGLALVSTMGLSIDIPGSIHSRFFDVAGGKVGPVPAQVIWALAAFAIAGFVLRYTAFGAHLYATGGNERAAMQMGVKTDRIKITTFVVLGCACGLNGALTTGWLRLGSPNTGMGSELSIIAAAIIGGTAITGGVGTATGTLIGAIIISMLQTGLVLLGVQGNWVQVYVGLLIVLAAGLEPYLRSDGTIFEWLRSLGHKTEPS